MRESKRDAKESRASCDAKYDFPVETNTRHGRRSNAKRLRLHSAYYECSRTALERSYKRDSCKKSTISETDQPLSSRGVAIYAVRVRLSLRYRTQGITYKTRSTHVLNMCMCVGYDVGRQRRCIPSWFGARDAAYCSWHSFWSSLIASGTRAQGELDLFAISSASRPVQSRATSVSQNVTQNGAPARSISQKECARSINMWVQNRDEWSRIFATLFFRSSLKLELSCSVRKIEVFNEVSFTKSCVIFFDYR